MFDRRVLDRVTHWVASEGVVLAVDHLSTEHLINVLQMLQRKALPLHLVAMVDVILDDGGRLEAQLIPTG